MADSKRDNNRVTSMLGVSNADGTTPVDIWADPATHRILASIIGEITVSAVSDTPESWEDTSFVTGDSPAILDLNAALGRNATKGYVINDGAGDFTVSFSVNGTDFGDNHTMKRNEIIKWDNLSVDSIRITWIADSAYRCLAV